jgi:hypothetical protein
MEGVCLYGVTMAKKGSASRDRLRRKRGALRSAVPVDPQILRELIEVERYRLMRAEAVLQCVLAALDDGDAGCADGPHYQSAIDVARDLIKQSIDRLDSVELPFIDADTSVRANVDTAQAKDRVSTCTNEVKEHASRYVH